MNRREFVFSLSALSLAPPFMVKADGGPPSLTGDEKKTLGQICERLIPKDEYPGALEAGVVNYIERLLREAHPDWIVVYRSGLRSTELSGEELYGQRFSALDAERQTELLKKMERGGLPSMVWFGIPGGEFFSMVLSHTMQGFYGHPKWGGNHDRAGWKMIGYDDWWA